MACSVVCISRPPASLPLFPGGWSSKKLSVLVIAVYRSAATFFAHMHRSRLQMQPVLCHNHEFAWHWLEFLRLGVSMLAMQHCTRAVRHWACLLITRFSCCNAVTCTSIRFRTSPENIQWCAGAAFVNLRTAASNHNARRCADLLVTFAILVVWPIVRRVPYASALSIYVFLQFRA